MAKGTLSANQKALTIKVGDKVRMTGKGGVLRTDETGTVTGRRLGAFSKGRVDSDHWVLDVSFPSGRMARNAPAAFFKLA